MAHGSSTQAFSKERGARSVVVAGAIALGVVSLLSIGERGKRLADAGSVGRMAAVAQTAAPPAAAPARKAGSFTPEQVKELHAIIKDYLVENPEVLAEVSQALEKKQAAEQAARAEKYLLEHKAKIFTSSNDFVIGNPKGDITVVEFFDYNCGWCKRVVDDLTKLTKADPKLRVVLKEYPIFGGPPSVAAAKAALASIRQGKYWEFHAALMRERQVTEQTVFTVAQRVGLDLNRLKTDMADKRIESTIQQNIEIGQGLGIEGTPGFLIDSRLNVGYVPADGVQKMLAEIRKTGCKVC